MRKAFRTAWESDIERNKPSTLRLSRSIAWAELGLRRRVGEPAGVLFRWRPPLTTAAFSIWRHARIISMSNPELIGCDLTWKRNGADWVLHRKRRRMGRVVPDSKNPGMYRIALSGGRLSDMANLSWAKNAVLEAAIRELEYEARGTRRHRAINPPKCPVKGGSLPLRKSLIHFSSDLLTSIPSRMNANPESLTAYSSATF